MLQDSHLGWVHLESSTGITRGHSCSTACGSSAGWMVQGAPHLHVALSLAGLGGLSGAGSPLPHGITHLLARMVVSAQLPKRVRASATEHGNPRTSPLSHSLDQNKGQDQCKLKRWGSGLHQVRGGAARHPGREPFLGGWRNSCDQGLQSISTIGCQFSYVHPKHRLIHTHTHTLFCKACFYQTIFSFMNKTVLT